MRELLFRGQTRKYGKKVNMAGEKLPSNWVYGGIYQDTGDFSVIYGENSERCFDKYVVYAETVGQYTGHIVKNGKLFEGDIIKYKNSPIYFIRWNQDISGFEAVCFIDDIEHTCGICKFEDFEIIGNIYDNPELLGECGVK